MGFDFVGLYMLSFMAFLVRNGIYPKNLNAVWKLSVMNYKLTITCLYINLKFQNYLNQALIYEFTNYINSLVNEGNSDAHFLGGG